MTRDLCRILVVDDEQHQLDTVCRGLFLFGFVCKGARSVADALEQLRSGEEAGFDLVLTDLTMPGGSGLELIDRVREEFGDLPIVVITGLARTAEIDAIRRRGIPILKKPFEPDTLHRTVRRALAGEPDPNR